MPSDSNPIDQLRQNVKASVKSAVQSTNETLAVMEDFYQSRVKGPIQATMDQSAEISAKVLRAYDRRHEYGPYWVAGSAILVGGIVGIRGGGKLRTVLTSVLASGTTYAVIYDTKPLENAMERLWHAASRKG